LQTSDKKCQDSCEKFKGKDNEKYVQCMVQCADKLKKDCFGVYNSFYEKVIGRVPEYKTLEKH